MPAPLELSQQITAPRAKARMQKPQGGGKFLVQIVGGAGGEWLWMKLIPAKRKLGIKPCSVLYLRTSREFRKISQCLKNN